MGIACNFFGVSLALPAGVIAENETCTCSIVSSLWAMTVGMAHASALFCTKVYHLVPFERLGRVAAMMVKYTDIKNLCAATGWGRQTVERYLRREDMKFPRPIMVGKKRMWPEHEIRQFLESRRLAA